MRSEPAVTTSAPYEKRYIALVCALAALAMASLALIPTLARSNWDPTALVRMVPNEPMALIARSADPDFAFVESGHYDGVYFYAIALDPVATELPNRFLDHAPYRYGHPGYGWLAALFSWGHPAAIPFVLPMLNLIGIALAAHCVSRLGVALGTSGWVGLAVAFSPGLLYAMTVDTSEPISAGLFFLGLWLWLRQRLIPAAALFALLCFVKEPFVLVPVGLALWEVVEARRGRRPQDLKKRLFLLAALPFPVALWWFYIYAGMGQWPFLSSPEALRLPPLGWVDAITRASEWVNGDAVHQLGSISLALLLATAGFLIAAAISSIRVRSPIDAIFLAQLPVVAGLSWLALAFPKDMVRNLAVVLVLAVLALCKISWPRRATGPTPQ